MTPAEIEALTWEPLSNSGNCLERANLPDGGVALRSSERLHAVITLSPREWASAQKTISERLRESVPGG